MKMLKKMTRILCYALLIWPTLASAGINELLSSLPGDRSGQETNQLLADLAKRGTPIIEQSSATFLVRSPDGKPIELIADINWWGRYPGANRLQKVPGTQWYFLSLDFAEDARIEYGYKTTGGEAFLDPNNPVAPVSMGEHRSVLSMPAYQPSTWFEEDDQTLQGALERFEILDKHSGQQRAIHVYQPPARDRDQALPVVFFNDGSAYATDARIPGMIDRLIVAGQIPPLVAVFVDPIDRGKDYRGQESFVRFMTDELLPRVETRFNTRNDQRAIIGGSRGALGALNLAWLGNGSFQFCGMFAPAITPMDILDQIYQAEKRPIRFYLVGARYDPRFIGDYYRALDTLRFTGYSIAASELPIGHSITAWKQQLPQMLSYFFPASATGGRGTK